MAQTQKRKNTRAGRWSWSVGDWGQNRILVLDRGARGLYVEFTDTRTNKRVRLSLGTKDRAVAKAKAEELVVAFRANADAKVRPVAFTLAKLFELTKDSSAEKSESKRKHDERCIEMYTRYWGASRVVSTLSIVDWNAFIRDRRKGNIAPAKAKKGTTVRNRVIEYDLRFLLSALRLATLTPDGKGGTLLVRNPLQGLPLPKEDSPGRPALSAEEYVKLRAIAASVHPDFEAALVLCHQTGHRMSSVRHLRWSDVDLEKAVITWRPEHDKIGFGHHTPLTEEGVDVLRARQKAVQSIGDTWIFPGEKNPALPRSRQTMLNWWKKACTQAGLAPVARRGLHSLRRAFASDMKDTPLRDLAYMGGWKSPQTLLTVYQQPDQETQREALANRRSVRVIGSK